MKKRRKKLTKSFHKAVDMYLSLSTYSQYYRLCWIPDVNRFSIIEFFDDELDKIDPKKIEVLVTENKHIYPTIKEDGVSSYVTAEGDKVSVSERGICVQTPEEQRNVSKIIIEHYG
jgi:predicted Mrr-cat superfamily restriction endonuclease